MCQRRQKSEKPTAAYGKTEIIFEMKSETERSADRADGIAGEIEKDLSGKRDHPRPRIERDQRPAVTKNAIGRASQHRIREHHFFEKAERHEQ